MKKIVLLVLIILFISGCYSNSQYKRDNFFYEHDYPGPHEGYRLNNGYTRGGLI